MKNILITGGAGFIGSRLCERLFEKDYNITVLDNLSPQIHENDESTLYRKIKGKCKFINGDVRSKKDWQKALKGQEIVVHFASETGTGQSMYELEKYNDVNIKGTSNMLEVLSTSNHSIKKIILSSSRSVYGEGKYKSKNQLIQYPKSRKINDLEKGIFNLLCEYTNEEMMAVPTDEESLINPKSIYALTKYAQEKMILLISQSLTINPVILRYQNVFGPGQSLSNPYTGILSIFSTRILNGNNLDIYEDGLESRDFVYIDDVIDATILAIENERANGEIFNVGSGIPTTIKEVAESLKKLYNSDVNINVSGKFRLGDIRHNYADLSKVESFLGYKPKYDFQEGITKFVKWVKNQEIKEDKYEKSIQELKDKGLMK
ncbi:MAG: epimerase [Flavobacteriales bacterium]|nr:epimerase [Flavobacteriales bacterium]|tara:strand:+ start:1777 stop:2904 length:1128 start_codon:yes stop_codon:yes gene_type:complete